MKHVLLSILILLYSILFEIIGFAAYFLSIVGIKRTSWHIKERRTLPPRSKKSKNQVVWIHAASLGETKILVRVLSILQEKYPDQHYVLTAVTESGVNYLRNHKTESVCAVGFLPLDTLFLMKKMIKSFGVSKVWLIETEIWPAMLWTCFKNDIPVGIVNARMEDKSFRVYSYFRWILQPFFSTMAFILAQNKQYAQRFKALGVPQESVHLTGNIKRYVSIHSAPSEKKSLIRKNMKLNNKDIVVTVGCLHPDETIIIRKAIEVLSSKGYTWKWIVVPRHLNKSQVIKTALGSRALLTQDINQLSSDWDICVIDSFGVLEDMYMIADAAVIGGTFNAIGGHNVWEAVQYEIPVFFGPDYHTQQESCQRILDAGVAFCVADEDGLADKLAYVTKKMKKTFTANISTLRDTMNKELSSLEAYL